MGMNSSGANAKATFYMCFFFFFWFLFSFPFSQCNVSAFTFTLNHLADPEEQRTSQAINKFIQEPTIFAVPQGQVQKYAKKEEEKQSK